MEPPSKRRRLSQDVSESSGEEDFTPAAVPEATSRIQPKQNTTSTAKPLISRSEDDISALPTAIQATLDAKSSFKSIGVDPWLIASLSHLSIKFPTRIQKACIPEILAGRDCIGGSRTGSGKTIAFGLPILQQWARQPSGIFALVLTPTRELALQIYEQFQAIGGGQGIKCVLVTGGAHMRNQALELAKRPHIVIATPGRLADHISSSGEDTIYGLRKCKFVVLDEADRLLASSKKGSMLPDVETCMSILPPASSRQTCLFTATITPEVRALKSAPRSPSRPPVFISEVDVDSLAIPDTLTQTYQLVNVLHKEKYLHILLLTPENVTKTTIIFTNRTETANLLEHTLRLLTHRVTALHSALPHEQRTSNLARFRAGAARILVATDVASRGLDVPDVGLVINYDIPRNPDDYIHRVGRTARAGRKGLSISLVGQRDVELVQGIEARVGRKMEVFEEEGVSVEGRVVRSEVLNEVGGKKREAMLAIEEGRDVKGNRSKGMGKKRKG
ncbi:ATP-dependent RNA helicase dbp8 [Zymoseptoria tritici IPO323]|uniref:ATP-dependent RNA helicase DBP8 n=1 Tax=Zymoseptoria tritici (strain CBS 115943 / IPO323) TaxID=336722 RepID=F9XAH6_ZYMTI|nr:ATP-dependent RNA helicase dbp8 [Zymoseptoria tritici IPO323]EGP87763.1 hypothetical protein MYCGRDRAFT_92934 [Zymoseptoria tritici IPO323]